MTEKVNCNYFQLNLLKQLDLKPFNQRFPWIGGDLQTLRDTFVADTLPFKPGESIHIEVPEIPSGFAGKGKLLAFLDRPLTLSSPRGLVLMLHGLGGSSQRRGLRRMTFSLVEAGFAVLRLNLRGADPGRELAGGTYSAKCNSDIEPVILKARELSKELLVNSDRHKIKRLPLFGVGLSLGGTILLNACLGPLSKLSNTSTLLDGLICVSSPLDLAQCSASIEKPRNTFYQYWLLNRLIRQTLADPFGISDEETSLFASKGHFDLRKIKSIRQFDTLVTAPRWAFGGVDDYYREASPINLLLEKSYALPQTFFIQALDDPWVPAEAVKKLSDEIDRMSLSEKLKVILTTTGGHNGFHGKNGCWGDDLVRNLLISVSSSII